MVNRIVFRCLCVGALLCGLAGFGLSRVRALSVSFVLKPIAAKVTNGLLMRPPLVGPGSTARLLPAALPETAQGDDGAAYVSTGVTAKACPIAHIVPLSPAWKDASARARRQCPGVLEPREKRQNSAIFNGGILPLICAVLPIGVTGGLDNTAYLSDAAAMTYTGGKNGAGVYQRIINLIPPHRVYIEPFLGSGAILRLKRPAEVNIGLDLDAEVISYAAGITAGCDATGQYRQVERGAPATRIELADASSFLKSYPWRGDELVYCDPPYLLSTRKTIMRDAYAFEMRDVDHREFLRCIRMVGRKAKVLISGYWSEMYAGALEGWNSTQFQAVTRGGTLATEWLWFNYPEPTVLHDYSYLGSNYRERERIKRKKRAWVNRLAKMPRLERQSLLAAFNDVGSAIDESGSARSPLAGVAGEDVSTTRLTDGAPCPETPVQGETAERSL